MVKTNNLSEYEFTKLKLLNKNEGYEIPGTATHEEYSDLKASQKCQSKHLMLLLTLGAVLFGIIEGFSLRSMNLSPEAIALVSYPGEIFMRLLKLVLLPLIVSGLITATAGANLRTNRPIAVRTLIYFVFTTFLNALLGICLALLIHPGMTGVDQNPKPVTNNKTISLMDSFLDLGRNLFPDNLFQASFQQVQTIYVSNKENIISINDEMNRTSAVQITRDLKYCLGTNTLGIIVFSLTFGVLLSTIGPKGQIVIDFFDAIFEVSKKMVTCVIWLAPICISSAIAGKILTVDNLPFLISQLMWFIATVVIGMFINQWILIQLIYYFVLRKSPFKFYFKLMEPLLTGAATASSAATLPLTFHCLNEEVGIDTRITQFILPIGMNMYFNGSSVFVPIATMFFAQMNGIVLGLGDLIRILLTTTIAIPSGSITLTIAMLSSINVPSEDIALLLAVDWLLDRLRTVNNILGNCYACAIVEHLSQKELKASEDDVALDKNCLNETKDRLTTGFSRRKVIPLSEVVVLEMSLPK